MKNVVFFFLEKILDKLISKNGGQLTTMVYVVLKSNLRVSESREFPTFPGKRGTL